LKIGVSAAFRSFPPLGILKVARAPVKGDGVVAFC